MKATVKQVIRTVSDKKRSRVTLEQVAKHAGVSRATASLVVRGSPNISKETRKKCSKR
ncbi:hypothetical protein TGS27_2304 [Geobacillus stearothermophilus]|uniref:HTH lacI-type domain-containing protein n=1 Tax=Geobacillus stearothermophilus TaxID=1422 RepID=A0ABQ7HDS7_GEOSE|nr:hypothetical protein GS8_2497 [Geobacillus stearothermophilus]OAO78935.1 hypothetical protein TGS27_2304 [Geobacillus stearothermophilus]